MTQELELQNYHRLNAHFNYLLKLVTMYVSGKIRKPRRHIRNSRFNYARLIEIRDSISKYWVGKETRFSKSGSKFRVINYSNGFEGVTIAT